MADDRMKNDDLKRDMGTGGRDDQDFKQGQQTPGRNPEGGQQGGQRKDPLNVDDEEVGGGKTGERGGQGIGQGRGGQER